MDRALRWPRSEQAARRLDLALCLAVFAVGIGGQVAATAGAAVQSARLGPVAVVLAASMSTVLWWRRPRPLSTLAGLVAVVVVAAGVVPPGLYGVQVGLAFVVVCFALGAWSEHRRRVVIVGAVLVGLTLLGSMGDGSGGGVIAATAVALAFVALPIVAGTAARSRRRELEEIERRLAESERRQDERARIAIQDERTRIARELHDVVAHHVSLIGVQAGAARASLGSAPDATRDALASIERSSRTAVGEMRQIVDVLQPGEGGDRSPQPGLADLPALVDRWREAGYDIAVDAPDPGPLPATLSLSCYRMVEEALTNVARHSSARTVRVRVRRGPDAIELTVHDPGPAVAPPSRGGGRGLVGMAERAAIFGGGVTAGATVDGGFAVVASVPVPVPVA